MRSPPPSVLLSVGTAGALVLLFVAHVAANVLRHAPFPVSVGGVGGLAATLWFIDGALRRRTGRIAGIVVSLATAGVLALVGVVGFAVLRDWTIFAWFGTGALIVSLVGLPLFRPSARSWFAERPGAPATR